MEFVGTEFGLQGVASRASQASCSHDLLTEHQFKGEECLWHVRGNPQGSRGLPAARHARDEEGGCSEGPWLGVQLPEELQLHQTKAATCIPLVQLHLHACENDSFYTSANGTDDVRLKVHDFASSMLPENRLSSLIHSPPPSAHPRKFQLHPELSPAEAILASREF